MIHAFTHAVVPVPVDCAAVKRSWSARGFSFGMFRDPPGLERNDLIHDADEYPLIASGLLEVAVDREREVLGPGGLVRIPRGARHSVKTVSFGGSIWLCGHGDWSKHDDR